MIIERQTYISVAISIACILAVTLSWTMLKWVWYNPKRLEKILKKQGLKGNPYKLLYGDSIEKVKMVNEARSKPMSNLSNHYLPRTLPFYNHTRENYDKCYMWNGPIPIVHISEPEQMREVFLKMNEYQKPWVNSIFKVVIPGLIQLEGEVWAKRKKLLNPAFHIEKLKLMLPAFNKSLSDMIKKWEEMTLETGSSELDAWSYLSKLTADVISRAAFGSSYEEGKKIFELITEQLEVTTLISNLVYIPWRRFVPSKSNRKIMRIDSEIRTLVKDIIKKRDKAIKSGEKPKDDLLGILLDSNLNVNNNNIGISHEEVIDECKLFYIAGQETTSTLLVWTLILLGKHQDWQSRARDEVLNTFAHGTPDFHGISHLKTVNMILQEVLRLYPPVVELNRRVCEDVKIGDFVIPKGALVNMPILHVHHNEKIWGDDAKQFKPERFSEGISKATGGNMSFFSFGWGPRTCIGSNFVMLEAKLVMVSILQRFSFELSPSYAHAPVPILTLQPQFGAPIILRRL